MTTPQLQSLYAHVMTVQHALHEAIRIDSIAPVTDAQSERRQRMCERAQKRLRAAVAEMDRRAFEYAV